MNLHRDIITIFSILCLLCLTFFFFVPSHIYFANKLDFSQFSYIEIVSYLLLLSTFGVLILGGIAWLIPIRHRRTLLSFVFCLSFLVWMQSYIFVWDYGPLDGREISWGSFVFHGFFEAVVWVTVFVVSYLFLQRWIFSIAIRLSLVLIVTQAISLGVVAVRSPQENFKDYIFDESRKVEFGRSSNVVVLILDTFQSDIFQEIIETSSQFRNIFDNFIYFPDALAGFPTTYATVSYILTGQQYDNSIPFHNFLENAFLKNASSVPKRLKEREFRVDMYPLVPKLLHVDKGIASNVKVREKDYFRTQLSSNVVLNVGLLEISLFRCLPHFLKQQIFQRWTFLPSKASEIADLDFLKAVDEQSSLGEAENVFKYYHLLGAHSPFILNENLENVSLPNNREGYIQQSKAALRIVGHLLEKMKQLEIFENSLILILGDHGFFTHSMGIAPWREKASGKATISEKIRASGLPLVLVKRPGAKGPLGISKTAVGLGDIAGTILREVNVADARDMISIFDTLPPDRKRRFLYFDNNVDGNYLSPFREFIVSGDAWRASSWTATGKIFSRHGMSQEKN